MGDELTLLLQKKMTGEITLAESARLQAMLQQWPEGAKLAEDVHLIWDDTAAYQYPEPVDLAHDFGQILQRIHQDEPAYADHAPKRAIRAAMWWRAVAAVFVLAVAAFSFRQWSSAHGTADLLKITNMQEDRQMVNLPDGSKIWLHQGASIAYPKNWTDAQYREISLQGYAYFEVEHQPEHPFRVYLPEGEVIEVLGTAFSVNSVENPNSSSVFVRSGSVRFSPDKQQKGATLVKGQKAVFDRKQPQIHISTPASTNELAWQTGGLEFIQTPLYQVIADLQNYYDVEITLSNTALRKCQYTAPLTRQPIEQVLQSLVLIYKFDLQKSGPKQFVLRNGQCE